MARRTAWLPALVAGTLAAGPVRADPLPIRIDYQAAPGCPGAAVFLDEIRWRTPLARVAAAGEEALAVEARVTRRGESHHGRLVLGGGRARVVREIDGAVCDEVVSALALVSALAVDPRASVARRPPPAPPAPPAPDLPAVPLPSSDVPSPEAPRPAAASLPPPDLIGTPLPVLIAPEEPEARATGAASWALAAAAFADFGIAPRPLFGGGIAAERRFEGRWAPSLHLAVEAGGTGSFDVGPGGASFVKAAGRVAGCAFPWRPAAWISLVPCLAGEGGVLYAEAVVKGSITYASPKAVAWAALGMLPRIEIGSGRWLLALTGGPVFPLVQQKFVFDTSPAYTVSTLPAVTGSAGLEGGVRFP